MTIPPHGAIPAEPRSIWRGRLLPATLGSFALVFLGAFESLAVTTVMPVVSVDLDGARLYALAFAGPLAGGVVGMVAAGSTSDRRGAKPALLTAIALFVVGLLVAGTAGSMAVLLAGRLLQGVGAGGMTVALYVLIARVYPAGLHPKVFAVFAAAWVLPALVGPAVAGLVQHWWGWRAVFLVVIGLVVPATAALRPALAGLTAAADPIPRIPWDRLGWAGLAAAGVLTVSLAAEIAGPVGYLVAALGAVVALCSVVPLLPPGSLRAARGLPATVLTRALLSAAFFGAEVYLPLLLILDHGFSVTTAGFVLTGAGFAWAAASQLQARAGDRLSDAGAVRIGTTTVLIAVIALLVGVATAAPAVVLLTAWAVSGAGMGLAYPRFNVMMLSRSTEQNQGFNSSALSIADSSARLRSRRSPGSWPQGSARARRPHSSP